MDNPFVAIDGQYYNSIIDIYQTVRKVISFFKIEDLIDFFLP